MALTGEEIRANLSRFAAHWTLYKGSERSEAQTFLNELLACYGTDRREAGAIFEAPQEGRFLALERDLVPLKPKRSAEHAVAEVELGGVARVFLWIEEIDVHHERWSRLPI